MSQEEIATAGTGRSEGLLVAERSLPLPTFFASVSSVKYDRPIADTLALLIQAEYPALLISAYDYAVAPRKEQGRIRKLAAEAHERGLILLVDSGRYESFWLRDESWARDAFVAAVRDLHPPLAFSFDAPLSSDDPAEIARDVAARTTGDQTDLPGTTVLPIIHGTPSSLPAATAEVAATLAPLAVAMPERELGDGILQRADTLKRVMGSLAKQHIAVPVHLLGTGDPLSILIYAALGAGSFDGLEWCHTVVNFEDATLHHLQHFDLFAGQSGLKTDGPFLESAQAHNLIFLIDWMRRIREASADELKEMIQKYVPEPGRQQIASEVTGAIE